MRLIIHAPGVNIGGGRSLLLALLQNVASPCVALLDERLIALRSPISPQVSVNAIGRSLIGRLAAEKRLSDMSNDDNVILCFGNLPPLFKCHGRVLLFLQNRYLVEQSALGGLPTRMQMKIRLDRLWLRTRLRNANCVIVQTASMARAVEAALGVKSTVLPFFSTATAVAPHLAPETPTFLYVASGEPHKNHRRLIAAWCQLARDGLRPRLILSLRRSDNPELYDWIGAERVASGLDLEFSAAEEGAEVSKLYAGADALIYPSLMESFGLPLLEAKDAGLPILAAERDYVWDLVSPAETFDPESEVSIARAVRRFLNKVEPVTSISSPSEFLARLAQL